MVEENEKDIHHVDDYEQEEYDTPISAPQSFLSNERIAQTPEELHEKLLFAGAQAKSKFEELDNNVATGFCDYEEVDTIRRNEDLIANIDFIENWLRKAFPNEDSIDLSASKNRLLRKIFFITLSSKSKDGFAIKSMHTQRNIATQSILRNEIEPPEKPSIWERLKNKTGWVQDKLLNETKGLSYLERKQNDIWR